MFTTSEEEAGVSKAEFQKRESWPVFWRVEGSLAHLTAVRPVAYFTWNSHTFAERWARRGGLFLQAAFRPALYASHRVMATRILHALLRGVSRDRLDLLGEEYFQYILKEQLRPGGVAKLREWMDQHGQVVLVSQGLDHVMRPLAQHLGIDRLVANRLEFRNGIATGRLLNPVIRPRGPLAFFDAKADGKVPAEQLLQDLGLEKHPELLADAIFPAARPSPQNHNPLVIFEREPGRPLSVRQALRGKRILLVGVTGFIAKVWLEHLLSQVPDIGKIYLLVRRQRTNTARRRFEKIVEGSPVFDRLEVRYGKNLSAFLSEKIEVVEGDVSQPGLGLDDKTRQRLARVIDVVVNSSGLTDFNPDLRDALAGNVQPAIHLIDFLRASDHAALLHLSTCYVVGARDGRVAEDLRANYTPANVADFDAEREWQSLEELVRKIEARAAERRKWKRRCDARRWARRHRNHQPPGREIDELIRKNRIALDAKSPHARGHAARPPAGLAQHLHVHQELGRIAARHARRRPAHRHRPALDRGNFHRAAFSRMERRHQYFRAAFLSAGHLFPAIAHERAQVPGRDSGGHGVPRHDPDRRGAGRAAAQAALSTGHLGQQSLRHGALDRADGAGAPQALPRAAGPGTLGAHAV